ncbi:ABC transporter permease subunit [Ruminococcaceae bacterium OttesenSCG-928-L11]|nr:ABC transporter permease subunit [Ruminococcaceae bacterium OttesenSCG-928-L11]
MVIEQRNQRAATVKPKSKGLTGQLKRTWVLYLFVLPALLYIAIFNYAPLYGIQIAFRDYKPMDGIWGSAFVGFKHFKTFFTSYQFWDLLRNTLVISTYSLLAGFPIPIVFALLLNYLKSGRFRKVSQMVTYAPHFISTVVFCGMIFIFLANDGIFNQVIGLFTGRSVDFIGNAKGFKHIYVWSGVMQGMGFNSIIYISALTAVSPELHEAAIVDGATKLQRIRHIDLPAILPTAIILLIMSTGQILNVGFEKAFLLQKPINLQYSEIISTYVYKIGITKAQYSYSTAIGLFNNLVSFIVLVIVNKISSQTAKISLW